MAKGPMFFGKPKTASKGKKPPAFGKAFESSKADRVEDQKMQKQAFGKPKRGR
jgi:hypothetical protein